MNHHSCPGPRLLYCTLTFNRRKMKPEEVPEGAGDEEDVPEGAGDKEEVPNVDGDVEEGEDISSSI